MRMIKLLYERAELKAGEFDRLFHEIGMNHLESIGFQFKNTGWHMITDDYRFSYFYVKNSNLASLSSRRLSIAFDRFPTKLNAGESRNIMETPDMVSPIQMNPSVLKKYVTNGFNDKDWHHSRINGSLTEKLSYLIIYYGGKPKRSLKDLFSNEKSSLEKSLIAIGSSYISEKETIALIEVLATNVANYHKEWSDHMTIDEIHRQINTYGDNLPVEEMWLGRYANR